MRIATARGDRRRNPLADTVVEVTGGLQRQGESSIGRAGGQGIRKRSARKVDVADELKGRARVGAVPPAKEGGVRLLGGDHRLDDLIAWDQAGAGCGRRNRRGQEHYAWEEPDPRNPTQPAVHGSIL